MSLSLSCSYSVLHFSPLIKHEKRPYWFISEWEILHKIHVWSFILQQRIHMFFHIYVSTFQYVAIITMLNMICSYLQTNLKSSGMKKLYQQSDRALNKYSYRNCHGSVHGRIRPAVTPLRSTQKSPDVITNIAIKYNSPKCHTLYGIHGIAIYGIM